MPRKSRIDAPGALHHIIVRGIERRKVFLDDEDRSNFLDRLGGIIAETGTGQRGRTEIMAPPMRERRNIFGANCK